MKRINADMSKKDKYTELITNTGVMAVGNFSSKVLVFMLVPLYTSVLTTQEYGFYDLIFTTMQLLIPIFSCNVTDGVLRFALDEKVSTKQLVNITFRYIILSLIPVSLILLFITVFHLSKSIANYSMFVFLYYFFYMLNQYLIQLAEGIDKVKAMAIAGVVGTFTTVISCLITLVAIKIGLKGFFLSNILGQAVPAVYLIYILHLWKYIDIRVPRNLDLEHKLLKYTIPLILTNIGWWMNNTSDKYIITAMRGISLNGLLSVAYKIPSILSIIYGLFIQAWQISAIKEYGMKDSKIFYNKIFIYLNYFVFYVASILILFTKPIAKMIFVKDFYNAWKFVPLLLVSSVITASAGFIAPILTSAYNTKAVVKSTIYGGFINIILNILLLYFVGDQGVAIATAISSFVIFYVRYQGLNGILEKKILLKVLMLWGVLIVQAIFEISGWYWMEILLLLCVSVLNIKYLYEFLCRVKRILKSFS